MIRRWFRNLARTEAEAVVEQRWSAADPEAYWQNLGRFHASRSGVVVSADRAMTFSPVWQGLDLITCDVARCKIKVLRRVQTEWGEGKEPNRIHPAYNALRRHTGYMNTDLWLSRLVGNALMYGDGFSQIRKRTSGIELDWLHPNWVEHRIKKSRDYYIIRRDSDRYEGNPNYEVTARDMFHLVGLTVDELGGLSLVDYARNTIGRGLSAEGYNEDYFLNGGPALIFSHPHRMSPDAQERFLREFEGRHKGQGNRFKVGLVEQGTTASQVGMSAKDAQMVEAMEWSVKDIARFFNLPPHKLGDDSRTSFNSVEEENRSYLNSSLGKWFSRFQFEANYKLFTDDSSFCEFNTDQLLRANTVDRWTAHNLAIQMRAKNPNEVRAEENLNPYEGGDQFSNPNIEPAASQDTDTPATDEQPETDDARGSLKALAVDQYRLLTDRLFLNAKRQSRNSDKFVAWLNSLDNWQNSVDDHIRCALIGCGLAEEKVPEYAAQYLAHACQQMLAASSDRSVDTLEQAQANVMTYARVTISKLLAKGESDATDKRLQHAG